MKNDKAHDNKFGIKMFNYDKEIIQEQIDEYEFLN